MKFTLKIKIKATAKEIYKTWLDSEGHTKMTGGKATASDKVGGIFSAWDGYITGKNISLEPYFGIKQTWRTTQFIRSNEDSILELFFEETNGETEITLIHSNLPEDGGHYKKGWDKHYFQPMKIYFSNSNL